MGSPTESICKEGNLKVLCFIANIMFIEKPFMY